MPEEYGKHIQFDEENNLSYNVKTPDYLGFTGNLGISNNEDMVLLIWPSLFGNKFKYGVRIQDDTGTYEIYINENLGSVTGNPEDKVIVEKYNNDIKNYMKRQRKNLKRSHKKEGVDKCD